MAKEGESSYTNLQVKKWRAITYDWDILSTYDDTARLYCLTDFQVAWLLSNTDYLRWQTRWSNCPCTQNDLDAMKAELEYNLMNCFDTRWMGQLDYVYQREADQQLNELELAYDVDGIPGINESTPTDYYSGDDSAEAIQALCMACDTYVRSYLNNWLQQASLLVGLVVILGVFVTITPFVGLIAGVVIAGLAFMTQTTVDAVNDNDAVNDVICCMYNGLVSQDVTQANFIASLNACSFMVGSNQAIIRDLVASDLIQDKNWFSFLNALGNSVDIANSGVVYDCPCVTVLYKEFDFTQNEQGFISDIGSVSGTPYSEYFGGLYWSSIANTNGSANVFRVCSIISPHFTLWRHVDYVEIDYQYNLPASGDDATFYYNNKAVQVNIPVVASGTHTLTIGGLNTNIFNFQFILRGATNNAGAYARVSKIRLYYV